nr:MAG TPA: nucleoporin [Caudoviricetes sp.]
MNEEEKNAVEYLKTRLYGNEGCKYIDVAQEDLRTFINLVDRKEKDIEGWKKYCEEIEEEQTEMSNKNCELEFEVEKLQKENEELKQDRNNNYQMIALAQNEVLGYMQGYEDGKKLKRSAVACVVENQQYYIIKKEIEHYKEYIEKLQKENEELKNKLLDTLEGQKVIEEETPQYIKENFIPVQKVKDKIEEINKKILNAPKYDEKISVYRYQKQILQELIEESEEN